MDIFSLLMIDAVVLACTLAFYVGYLVATYQRFTDEPEVKTTIKKAIDRSIPTTP